MGVFELLGSLFLVAGCVFALTGSVGVLRLPDFYSRLHPAGKSDTLGQMLILMGLVLFAGQDLFELFRAEGDNGVAMIGVANIMLKLGLLSGLLFVTAPTSTHAISKAARLDGHTHIAVDNDPGTGQAQVGDIVVAGDTHERLDEAPGQVFDVREDKPSAEDEP